MKKMLDGSEGVFGEGGLQLYSSAGKQPTLPKDLPIMPLSPWQR